MYRLWEYGNVMCSRGSVIPLFINQIKEGKPITITNPDMTRFLMNLDEAVELVKFAFVNAEPGDLFVQKADASTIGDLAMGVQQLFGDTGIRIIGNRHGEKLAETLLTKEERVKSIDMGDYFRVPADNRDLNYAISWSLLWPRRRSCRAVWSAAAWKACSCPSPAAR